MERMGLRAVSPTLIGRHAELAELHRALDVVAGGGRAVVLLAGEAGIGKTRLLQELVERARGAGFHSCVGRCLDLGAVAVDAVAGDPRRSRR
jgi:serine kinase of HPr protein (carbohydrate metabolism regulator)